MNNQIQAIHQYITEIDKTFSAGNATEHSYRPALKPLLEAITSGLAITNEPKHIMCGAPDYIITRDSIPLGYIEAKDISVGLDNKANKAQFDRYKQSLDNLIITDYLTFQLYFEGNHVVSVTIARESGGSIAPDKKQYDAFLALVNKFIGYSGKTIYQSQDLARMMAARAKLLAEVIRTALLEKGGEDDTLSGQLEGFRKILIHNLSEAAFADMYAQTLAYGLFAARLNQKVCSADHDNQTFSRVIAAHLVPRSNPFLRKFFQYIAGFDLDTRIRWIVDALADLFNYAAVEDILKEFGKANQDPYIHFYETFLAEYDPALRESRGVYYTPLPVVRFIVQAVDDILQKEFGLAQGLADNSKIKLPVKGTDKQGKPVITREKEYHKVQILDPAAGTGTFLAEIISNIYKTHFENQKGMWAGYCAEHLIPRLNGFEILMASYAMAHFKLDMTLKDTEFSINGNSRLQVYLTNTLEEPENETSKLPMVEWLTQEANEANGIKNNTPVMVILGNPPYSGISQNTGKWITDLIEDYKYVDGIHFGERKHWLQDDYVKFIRFGQYFIEKNGEGILAYINNHSFLDNPTFRGMRWSLLNTFDKIYILDLHGNTKKKETSPDGGKDENVFDIQQGVSINFFVKTSNNNNKSLADVYHADLYGKRLEKYNFLYSKKLSAIPFVHVDSVAPFYFFISKNKDGREEYEQGFRMDELMHVNSVGCVTANDALNISFTANEQNIKINELLALNENLWREKYNRKKDSRDWTYLTAKNDAEKNKGKIFTISYRPFDVRYTCYSGNSRGIYSSPQSKIMRHFIAGDNIGIVIGRQGQVVGSMPWNLIFVTKNITDFNLYYRGGGLIFPLYLYPDKDILNKTEKRRPNINIEIVSTIAEKLNLRFTEEKEDDKNTFAPIDIFDYIYAVLHSPAYRTQYKEFLKFDFPRIPCPVDTKQFRKLAGLGGKLRAIHLLEGVMPSEKLAGYPVKGSNTIDAVAYKDKKVWINKTQYFESVPPEAWNFYIGGYQPAQKWLKDRKGRTINYDEIQHYQKIVNALCLTGDLQRRIDGAIGGLG